MKRFIMYCVAVVCAVSCFDDGPSYRQSYTLAADFETIYDFGADSLCFDSDSAIGFAWPQGMAFYHKLDDEKSKVIGGFVLSRLKGSGNDPENNRFRVNPEAKETEISQVYTVFTYNEDASMMPLHDVQFLYSELGTCSMIGCYVNNTREVVDSVRSRFEIGDRLTLKAVGYLDGKKTGETQMNLADFSAQKDSVVTEWTAFNLSKLGSVQYVEFEVISTKPDVPTVFCMDDMYASVSLAY